LAYSLQYIGRAGGRAVYSGERICQHLSVQGLPRSAAEAFLLTVVSHQRKMLTIMELLWIKSGIKAKTIGSTEAQLR
jgi:hypothetical protein